MSDRGTFGWKGTGKRALEFPAGDSVGVAPPGRARLRLNNLQVEASVNGSPYAPFATSSGGVGLVVDTVSALTTLDDTALQDGVSADVARLLDDFVLDKSSTLVADGVLVVATMSSIGRWVRSCKHNTAWQTVTDWYLDPVLGDDANSGDVANPIATWNELRRRIGPSMDGNVEVHFSANDVSEQILIDFAINGHLTISGTLTEIFSGTITGRQVRVKGSAEQQLACNGIPVSWTASGLVGGLLLLTSGANTGAGNFVVKDLGAKNARMAPLVAGTYSAGVNPEINDQFKVYSMTKFTNWFMIQVGSYGWLTIKHIDIQSTPGGPSMEVLGGVIGFFQCRLGIDTMQIQQGSGVVQTDACYFYGTADGWLFSGDIDCYNTVLAGPMNVVGGRIILYDGNVVQGPNGRLVVGSYGTILAGYATSFNDRDLAFFDCTTRAPIEIEPGGFMYDNQYVWGSGNTYANAIVIRSDGSLVVRTNHEISISGASVSDALVGGNSKTFAEVAAGYVHPTNMARAVVFA